jgi:Uncharacterised methyltransferase family (DUF6094)
MFDRTANNFVKKGYFPTDLDTLSRVGSMLALPNSLAHPNPNPNPNATANVTGTKVRLCDPCIGEGEALATLKAILAKTVVAGSTLGAPPVNIHAYGLEIDRDRYELAMQRQAAGALDMVAYGDIQDTTFNAQQYGLVLLNPPYGDMLTDKAELLATGAEEGQKRRFELYFLQRMVNTLQPGGVLVYIIPLKQMTPSVAALLAKQFDRLTVHLAPVTTYKQAVIVGIRARDKALDKTAYEHLLAAVETPPATLPVHWSDAPYTVPEQLETVEHLLSVSALDARVLTQALFYGSKADEGTNGRGMLWERFESLFRANPTHKRPSLNKLTPWHLALGLASGQVNGFVRSSHTGRYFLVKGNTIKTKDHAQVSELENGKTVVTHTATDRFRPLIKAIDMTPGGNLGMIVQIV